MQPSAGGDNGTEEAPGPPTDLLTLIGPARLALEAEEAANGTASHEAWMAWLEEIRARHGTLEPGASTHLAPNSAFPIPSPPAVFSPLTRARRRQLAMRVQQLRRRRRPRRFYLPVRLRAMIWPRQRRRLQPHAGAGADGAS